MAQGMDIPVRVNKHGGAKLASGDSYLHALIIAGLSDGSSDNPFLNVGILNDVIFGLNNGASRGMLSNKIKELFQEFEQEELGSLDTDGGGVIFDRSNNAAEIAITIKYINLQSQEPGQIKVGVSSTEVREIL